MDRITDAVLQVIIARVLETHTGLAIPLLLTSKKFANVVLNVLYEEIYIADCDSQLNVQQDQSRATTVLRRPEMYGKYVRTLIVVSQYVAGQSSKDDLVFDLEISDREEQARLSPKSIAFILSILPLSTLIWASDRAPSPQLVPLVGELCPSIINLALRPAQTTVVNPIASRWDGGGIGRLSKLKRISVSHLSSEGIRSLTSTLSSMLNLADVTIDSKFADDNLLKQIGDMNAIQRLTIRCTGTKITDKGILWLLKNSFTLQSLDLKDFEGRLSKHAWSNVDALPDSFKHIRLSFAEEGPHHSWVADHINSTFSLFAKANKGLVTFSLTTNPPKPKYYRLNGTEQVPTPSDGMQQVKCLVANPCDPLLRPRKLPAGALESISKYGEHLQVLALDLFPLSIEEVKVILDSCRQLRILRILLDAPLTKLLGMSSTFVPLQHLHTLYVSVTDAFCPMPYIIQTLPEDHAPLRNVLDTKQCASFVTTPQMPDLSPASAHTSLSASEHEAISPSSSPQLLSRVKDAAGRTGQMTPLLLFNGPSDGNTENSLGCINKLISSTRAPDVSLPPKRDIRKLARRCPTLEQVKWYGRTGKGDWLIGHSASSKHTAIYFVPIYMTNTEGGAHDLVGGGDVQHLIEQQRIANNDDGLIINACQNTSRDTGNLWQDYGKMIEEKVAAVPSVLLDDFDFPQLKQQHQQYSDDSFSPTPTTSRFRQTSVNDVFSPLSGLFSRSSFQSFEQTWPNIEEPLSPFELRPGEESPLISTYGARRASSGAAYQHQNESRMPSRGRRATMSSGRATRALQSVILSSLPSAQADNG